MTRADAIRKMSDEELAVFMARLTLGRAPTDREFLFALSHHWARMSTRHVESRGSL